MYISRYSIAYIPANKNKEKFCAQTVMQLQLWFTDLSQYSSHQANAMYVFIKEKQSPKALQLH
jgi:hypothetical protein